MKKYLIAGVSTILSFSFGVAFYYNQTIKQDDCDEVQNNNQAQLTQYEYTISPKKNLPIAENYNNSTFFIITDKDPNMKTDDGKYLLIDIKGDILKDEIAISEKSKFIDILVKLEYENSDLVLKFNDKKKDIMQIQGRESMLKIPVSKLKSTNHITIENSLGIKVFDKKIILKSANKDEKI